MTPLRTAAAVAQSFAPDLGPIHAVYVGPRKDKQLVLASRDGARLYRAAALVELERILLRDARHPQTPSRSFNRRLARLAKIAGVRLDDVARAVQIPALYQRLLKQHGEPASLDGEVFVRGQEEPIGGIEPAANDTWLASSGRHDIEQGGFASEADAVRWIYVMEFGT